MPRQAPLMFLQVFVSRGQYSKSMLTVLQVYPYTYPLQMKFQNVPTYLTGFATLVSGFATLGIYKTGQETLKDREIDRKLRISQNIEKQLDETRSLVHQLLYEDKHEKASDCIAFLRITATGGSNPAPEEDKYTWYGKNAGLFSENVQRWKRVYSSPDSGNNAIKVNQCRRTNRDYWARLHSLVESYNESLLKLAKCDFKIAQSIKPLLKEGE